MQHFQSLLGFFENKIQEKQIVVNKFSLNWNKKIVELYGKLGKLGKLKLSFNNSKFEMPFNNFLGKFFDPKGLDKQFSSELNILDEPEMPRELRDSLKSNELKEIMSNTQNFMEQSVEYIPNYQDTIDADEERYSDARSHDDAEENDGMY